jgi:hypothetical protein
MAERSSPVVIDEHRATSSNCARLNRRVMRIPLTWDTPRFLRSFDETLDGELILPRGLAETVTSLAEQTSSRLEITEIHDYHDTATSVLAASLAKRAPRYASLGFPDPRRVTFTQFRHLSRNR